MTHNAENDVPSHRPECWCNGTGWRRELGVPCNLPQLTDSEHAYVLPPDFCLCGYVDDLGDGTCGNCGLRIMTEDDEARLIPPLEGGADV